MQSSWWFSIGMGVVVVGLHAAARVVTHRFALRRTGRSFVLLELGGLGIRMGFVLGAVALLLLYVPMQEVAFVGTVVVLFIATLIAETRLIVRRMDRGAL